MIKGFLVKVVLIVISAIGLIFSAFLRGKQAQRTKQLEENIKNVKKFKLREKSRRGDSSSTIRKRLSKYIRK